jgi:hypothetical protein
LLGSREDAFQPFNYACRLGLPLSLSLLSSFRRVLHTHGATGHDARKQPRPIFFIHVISVSFSFRRIRVVDRVLDLLLSAIAAIAWELVGLDLEPWAHSPIALLLMSVTTIRSLFFDVATAELGIEAYAAGHD